MWNYPCPNFNNDVVKPPLFDGAQTHDWINAIEEDTENQEPTENYFTLPIHCIGDSFHNRYMGW